VACELCASSSHARASREGDVFGALQDVVIAVVIAVSLGSAGVKVRLGGLGAVRGDVKKFLSSPRSFLGWSTSRVIGGRGLVGVGASGIGTETGERGFADVEDRRSAEDLRERSAGRTETRAKKDLDFSEVRLDVGVVYV
jgi:hypothetical protein